jgi:hypothetical protein
MYPDISNVKRLARDLALTCDYIEVGDPCYNELIGRKPFYFTRIVPVNIYNPETFEPFKIVWFVYEGKEFRIKISPELYSELDNCAPISNINPIIFDIERSVKDTVIEPYRTH